MSEEMALKIDADENLKSKFKVFDHHISGIELNKFSFITVIDEIDGRKESGTSIYYNYLKGISNSPLLLKKSSKGLVNQVRTIDTYDFSEISKEEAKNIDALFGIFGRDEYINYFTKYIEDNDEFEYTEKELYLIRLEKNRMDRYIESKEKEMMRATLDGYNVGIVYAERYRSDLGNYLAEKYEDLDFIILINVARSISYRGIDKADLSVISKKYGGGGHKNAAGSPIANSFLKTITKLIYSDINFVEEKEEN